MTMQNISPFRPSLLAATCLAFALVAPAAAKSPELPQTAPRPQSAPLDAANPQSKPPIPAPREDTPPPLVIPRHISKTPEEETACRAQLTALGVEFEEETSINDPIGCTIEKPLKVSTLGHGFDLEPAAVTNCAMALAAATFVRDTIAPTAKEIFGSPLVLMRQDSAYVCRPRNGTSKLSEHAFGNALDLALFRLGDGTEIEVGKSSDTKRAKFLNTIRRAACGPFKTVLGPGSDADHAFHFHFDLAYRKSGSTFCQ